MVMVNLCFEQINLQFGPNPRRPTGIVELPAHELFTVIAV